MTDRPDGELDPELAEWLAGAREDDAPRADYEALFEGIESRIGEAEKKPSFWLRTRSTLARRGAAALTAVAVIVVGGVVLTKREIGAIDPLQLALSVGAIGTLLGLSLHHALRPLHKPPLSPLARGVTVALALIATFVLALFPPHDEGAAPFARPLLDTVSPCLFYGLLMGVPVYLALRLLDRGTSTSSLLAACAAGLAGNLAVTLHCPSSEPMHLMLAHFTVALLFVAGLGLAHVVTRARAR